MSAPAGRLEHMFDHPASRTVDSSTVRSWATALRSTAREVSDAERIDQLRALEELKSAAAAAQARAAADLDESVRRQHAAAGLPARQQGRGVASQVALARKDSPSRGGRHLGLAKALVHEMPFTLAALTDGRISEWRATLMVRETACLSREERAQVDREVAADPDRLDQLGDRALAGEARRVAYRLDPMAVLHRSQQAASDRRVSLRPAPDTMSHLTSTLPVTQGVAAYTALSKEADRARADGDPRSRGQIMADTLVERVTGQAHADGTPVEVQLVMTDRTLLAGDNEPAVIPGYGPVSAPVARELVRPTGEMHRAGVADRDSQPNTAADADVWVRRLFTHPATNELLAMESRARCFPTSLRGFLVVRDQICRTPWCDAPVRHADHATRHSDGGATEADNGQGLCERCNYEKQAPGWRARPAPGGRVGRHRVETVTPTGHRHVSRPPPLPGRPAALGRVDLFFAEALHGRRRVA